MCGRFTFDISPDVLEETFELAEHPPVKARYNIAPTQLVPVIRQNHDGQNGLDYLHWGLIPSWAKEKSIGYKMINARSETIREKPAFRQAVKYRRCVLPASGFYEWRREGAMKIPHYIRLKDSVMLFAGLWETWKSPEGQTVESCTILTTAPNRLVEPIHDRMPVILHPDEFKTWLDRTVTDPLTLEALYQPYPADLMDIHPVSPLVNTTKHDSIELTYRIDDRPAPGLFD